MSDLLAIYLNDHLTGAMGGVSLAHRIADAHAHDAAAAATADLAKQIEQDRRSLVTIMRSLEVRPVPAKNVLGLIGGLLGRLKLNGALVRRSPLSNVVEFEALMLGVQGKAACWRSLLTLAETDRRLVRERLQLLLARADDQVKIIERLRIEAVGRALARPSPTRGPVSA